MNKSLALLGSLFLRLVDRWSASRVEGQDMSKAEFDRQRQLLWLYLRRQGKCSVCGLEMSRTEAATVTAIPVALGIDELLQLQLVHVRCRRPGVRGIGSLAA